MPIFGILIHAYWYMHPCRFAGSALPFPTIYTGGIVPDLWKPITGPHSFNIPPLVFDLAPFLGLLNDGYNHTIAVKVVNNCEYGVWFIDPVLRTWYDHVDGRPVTGRVTQLSRAPPYVSEEVSIDACIDA